MKIRKITAVIIASALSAVLLSACGTGSTGKADGAGGPESPAGNSAAAGNSENEETEPAGEIETTAAATETSGGNMDITAAELASEMTIGWNVGNSLDAMGEGINSETGWGNPKISEALIRSVKEAGFNTLRIPVTWQGHYGEAPDYKIDDEWLARVKEVVDYAIENDMYAIVNVHHDGADTDTSWLTPVPDDEEAMVGQFTKIWEQIAEYFKDYDERLIFAGMNEFHHGYGNPTAAYLALTDRLNQTFVDTVRASGGNNEQRILIVQGYNTNGEHTLKMTVPTDSAANKLMVEFHFYDPYTYALQGNGDWGVNGVKKDNWGQEDWVDNIFGRAKKQFVDNGIPVVIGEYGAVLNKDGNDDFRRYYIEYVTKAAKENGLLPIYWDNGYDGTNGEGFAIFDRATGAKLHEDIHEGMMRAVSGEDYEIPLPTAE